MPISADEKNYPICDTDIWIDASQINNLDIIFQKNDKVFIPDAVRQELGNKKDDDEERYGCCLEAYKNESSKGKIICMRLNNGNIFNKEQRESIKSAFLQFEIYYDENTGKFIGRHKHLGEKVCCIYASAIELSVILSDDGDTDSFINKYYSYLTRTDFHTLLYNYGYDKKTIDKIINDLNQADEIKNAEKRLGNKLIDYKTSFSDKYA